MSSMARMTVFGRRGPAGLDMDGMVERHLHFVRRIAQHVEHRGRAAHMGDAVLAMREDQRRIDLAQAHMGARHRHHRPAETPAVAMEQRQRPQIDRLARHLPRHDVAERLQIGAAVGIDDALRPAGGAGGVVERDRLPLVLDVDARVIVGRPGDERLVVADAMAFALALEQRVVDVDNQRARCHPAERRR
jgi:hypothetical protein